MKLTFYEEFIIKITSCLKSYVCHGLSSLQRSLASLRLTKPWLMGTAASCTTTTWGLQEGWSYTLLDSFTIIDHSFYYSQPSSSNSSFQASQTLLIVSIYLFLILSFTLLPTNFTSITLTLPLSLMSWMCPNHRLLLISFVMLDLLNMTVSSWFVLILHMSLSCTGPYISWALFSLRHLVWLRLFCHTLRLHYIYNYQLNYCNIDLVFWV